MNFRHKILQTKGVTLVELLVVTFIMGLVITGIYGLHLNTQRSAYTQDEVVEVQQNLRVAMDQMTQDLRMAHFLIGPDHAPFSEATASALTIRTSSINGRKARIAEDFTSPSDPATVRQDIEIATSEMVDFFESGQYVRIVRPTKKKEAYSPDYSRVFVVDAKDRTGPHLDLRGFDEVRDYQEGDLIIPVADDNVDGDDDPNTHASAPVAGLEHSQTIRYFLEDDPDSSDPTMKLLKRETFDGGAEIVAMKVSNMELGYLLEDGREVSSPTATELEDVVAVRILLTGATDATQMVQANFSKVKTRSVSGVVRLRNL